MLNAKSASSCWTLRVVLVIMVSGTEVHNAPDLSPTAKTVILSQGSVSSASSQSMPTFASAIVLAADLTIQKNLHPRSLTMLQANRPIIFRLSGVRYITKCADAMLDLAPVLAGIGLI